MTGYTAAEKDFHTIMARHNAESRLASICREKANDIRTMGAATFHAHWLEQIADCIDRRDDQLVKARSEIARLKRALKHKDGQP